MRSVGLFIAFFIFYNKPFLRFFFWFLTRWVFFVPPFFSISFFVFLLPGVVCCHCRSAGTGIRVG